MGSSLFRKLLLDDSDEDEIIKEVVMDSTSRRKRRSYIRRNHLGGQKGFTLTTLPTYQFIQKKYFGGDFG